MYQNSYRSSLIILTDNKKGAQISYPEDGTLAMLDAHDETSSGELLPICF